MTPLSCPLWTTAPQTPNCGRNRDVMCHVEVASVRTERPHERVLTSEEVPAMRRPGTTVAAMRRALAGAAVLILAAAGLVLGTAGSAYACSCAQASLDSLAKNADTVFVGTVDSQRTEGGERVYSLRVSDVYSGSPGQTTVVRTAESDAACGMSLRLHRQYMVVGEQPTTHGDVSVTSCSGTRPISDRAIAAVERALGPATPYRGVPDRDGGQHGGQSDKGGDTQGDGQSQNESADGPTASQDGSPSPSGEASESQDESSTSKVVVGVVLALAVGGAFLLPRLRRHNRGGSGRSED